MKYLSIPSILKVIFIIFFVSIGIAIILVVTPLRGFIFSKLVSIPILNEENNLVSRQRINFPDHNILVFTKCERENWEYKKCDLYISELFKPWLEQKIYSFDYVIKLVGISDRKLVYTTERSKDNVWGILDLETLDSQSYQSTLHTPFLDTENKKMYFSAPDSENLVFYSYDLETGDKKELSRDFFDSGYGVLFVKDKKLYLYPTGAFSDGSWSSTYDLENNMMIPRPEGVGSALDITRDGKKIVYVEKRDLGNYRQRHTLKVSDIDGRNVKELQTVDTKLIGEGTEINFFDVKFNPQGNLVTAMVSNYNKPSPESIYRVWNISKEEPKEYGVLTLPWGTRFDWVEYVTDTGRKYEAIVYQIGDIYSPDGAWYFSTSITSRLGEEVGLDLTTTDEVLSSSIPQVIVSGSQDLIIIP